MKIYNVFNLPLHIVKHSPTGLAWGYAGSGPADLALSLLTDVIGREEAEKYYRDYTLECVANFPHGRWQVTSDEIKEWYNEKRND